MAPCLSATSQPVFSPRRIAKFYDIESPFFPGIRRYLDIVSLNTSFPSPLCPHASLVKRFYSQSCIIQQIIRWGIGLLPFPIEANLFLTKQWVSPHILGNNPLCPCVCGPTYKLINIILCSTLIFLYFFVFLLLCTTFLILIKKLRHKRFKGCVAGFIFQRICAICFLVIKI